MFSQIYPFLGKYIVENKETTTKRSCIVAKATVCIYFCTQSINFDRQNFSILNKESFFSHVILFD